MKKIILAAIFSTALLVRLWRIDAPLADWHSWRQADTAAVARNFLKFGYDLLHPRFDDLSNIPSGQDNPEGYRFVEFPLYNALHAFLFQAATRIKVDWLSFEAAGRLVSILFWLLGGWWLYLLVFRRIGERAALASLFFFLFLPYNIYYSRTILPGPSMVAVFLGSILFLEQERWLVSLVLAATAVLIKPYAIFLLIPSWLVYLVLWWRQKKTKRVFFFVLLYVLAAILPFLLWRWWMRQFPQGIPANRWLLNLGGIRLRPAWWRWLFAERLAKLILGYWGTVLLVLGCLRKMERQSLLFWSWLVGGFVYLVVFARGNVQHDYYQILLAPPLAVFLGLGVDFLFRLPTRLVEKPLVYLVLGGLISLSLAFAWYSVRDYYLINHPEIVAAGKKAQEILPPKAKVIAPYGGDTAFLYQINRPGWPAITGSLEELIDKGATHYVSVNDDETTRRLKKNCLLLYADSQKRFWIIDLRQCRSF